MWNSNPSLAFQFTAVFGIYSYVLYMYIYSLNIDIKCVKSIIGGFYCVKSDYQSIESPAL